MQNLPSLRWWIQAAFTYVPGDPKATGNKWSHTWQACKHDSLISGCFNPRKDEVCKPSLYSQASHLLRSPEKSGVTHSKD